MDKNDSYFYLSGFLSLSFFTIVVVLFSTLVISGQKVKSYALQKQKYIAVSVNLSQKVPTQNNAEPAPLPKPKPKSKPDPTPEKSTQKVPDISSLFSTVSSKKIVYKKKPVQKKRNIVNEHRVAQMQKRIKTTQKRESTDAQKKIKNLKLAKPSVREVGASASGGAEVNQYYAKIQAFVYQHFYPPANSEGTSAKVRIWLSASGRLSDYRVMAYSANSMFNSEVDQLKQRLSSLSFPRHPNGKSLVLDIILVSEE